MKISTQTSLRCYEVNKTTDECNLEQNYPHPFNSIIQTQYQIVHDEEAELIDNNWIGENILLLANEQQSLGSYVPKLNAYMLASGVYFYHLKDREFKQVRKMIHIIGKTT